jgi:hypothetical protein
MMRPLPALVPGQACWSGDLLVDSIGELYLATSDTGLVDIRGLPRSAADLGPLRVGPDPLDMSAQRRRALGIPQAWVVKPPMLNTAAG